MAPLIKDRDVIVLDVADQKLTDGGVFAFNYDGELVVRRAEDTGINRVGPWCLVAENSHPRSDRNKVLLFDATSASVIGRVVRREGNLS
jgi:phage repressor protein C with HTH and peptisase S24 domain